MDTNIQVGIRVRPLIEREIQAHQKLLWQTDENRIFNQDRADYQFDKVFGQNVNTAAIYREMGKPLVDKAMEGFNGTLFAYGQTASGKTHTIMGDNNEPGVVPMAIQDVFNHINDQPDREFLLRASYLEIYNEEITDLVANKKGIKIRNNVDNEIVIDNLTEHTIISYGEAIELIQKGLRNRKIGTTNMNERSSRSHVIFRLVMESRQLSDELNMSECDGAVIVSQLNLVDLAGSERAAQTGAQGIRLKESAFINTSLMTLGVVIRKLSENDGHVPYRDSKLTRILQNSLGGNARTSIICTVSPVVLEETDQTLKFAGRAKNVKNKPKINEVLDGDTMLRRQMNEIKNLKRKIQELEGGAMHAEMILEKDMMLAEQQSYRQKIDEQQYRISKLLKTIICSGPGRKRANLASKMSRRQTWCPGGLAHLRSLTDTELNDKAKSLNTNRTISRIAEEDPADQEQVNISVDADLNSTQAFEKIEYGLLLKEFDEFKASTCSPEEYMALKSSLGLAEMEGEALKNRARDLQTECERLRGQLQNSDELEWQKAMELTLEQKCAENAEFSSINEKLVSEKTMLEKEVNLLSNQVETMSETLSQVNLKYDVLSEQQDKMVSLEYLEQLKKEVMTKSLELEEENKKSQLENDELRSAVQAEKNLHKEEVSSLKEENSRLKQEVLSKTEIVNEITKQEAYTNSNLQQTVQELKEQLDLIMKERDGLVEKQHSDEKNLEVMLNEVYHLFGVDDLTSLRNIMEKERADKVDAETKLHELQEQLQAYAKEQNELQLKFEENNDLLLNSESEKNALKHELEKNYISIEQSVGEKDLLHEKLQKEGEMMKQYQIEIENRNMQLIEKQSEIQRNEIENKELQLKLDEQIKVVTTLEQLNSERKCRKLSDNDEDDDATREEVERLTATLENKVIEFNNAKKDMFEQVEYCKSLESELSEVKQQLVSRDDLQQQKQALHDENEKWKAELENTKLQHERVVQENVTLKNQLGQVDHATACQFKESHNMNEKVTTLENLTQQLQSDVADLNVKLQEANQEIQGYHEDAELKISFQQKLKELQTENENEKQQNLDLKNEEVNNLMTKYDAVRQQYDAVRQQYEETVSAKDEIETKLDEIQQQNVLFMNEFQDEIVNFQIAKEDQVTYIQSKIKEMKEENTKFRQENQEFMEIVKGSSGLKEQLEKRNSELTELTKEISVIKQQLTDAVTKNDAEETVCKLQEENHELKKANEKVQGDINVCNDQIEACQFEISSLKEANIKSASDMESLIIEKSSIECLVESLSQEKLIMAKEIAAKTDEIIDLNKCINEASNDNATVQELTNQINAITLEKEELMKQLGDSTKQISELSHEKDELEECKSRLEEALKEKNSLESDIATLKDVIESQGGEAEVLQNAFEKKCEIHLELNNKYESLSEDFKTLNTDYDMVKKQIEHVKIEKLSIESEHQSVIEAKNEQSLLLTELQQKETEFISTVNILQAKLASLQNENNALLQQDGVSKEYNAQLDEKEVIISENGLEILHLQNQVRNQETMYSESCQIVEKLKAEKEGLQNAVNEERGKAELFEEKLLTIQSEREKLQTVIHEKEEAIQHLESVTKDHEDKMRELKDVYENKIQNLISTKSSTEENLQAAENLLLKTSEHKEEYERILTLTKEEKEKLSEELNSKNNAIKIMQNTIDQMKSENEEMCKQLENEKLVCDDEKKMAKKAYERRSVQTEARSLELVSTLKKLQGENTRSELDRDSLTQRIRELQETNDCEHKNHEKESLKHLEEIKNLKNELRVLNEKLEHFSFIEEKTKIILDEKERLIQQNKELSLSSKSINDELSHLRTELANPTHASDTEKEKHIGQYSDVSHKSISSSVESDSLSKEQLLEKLGRLEYRLQLRKEDIVVYTDRVNEQDDEIYKLKKKNRIYDVEMKRLTARMSEIRRPSGHADVKEWEDMVCNLETIKIKLEQEKEMWEEKYLKLEKETGVLKQSLNNASKRIPQLEKALKDVHHHNKGGATNENEIKQLKDKITKQEAEIERITNGLKTAFGRMQAAEAKLTQKQNEFVCEIKKRDDEYNKVTSGLTVAFTRYKHYKDKAHAHEKEIEMLQSKLKDVEHSVLSSMKESSCSMKDNSSATKENFPSMKDNSLSTEENCSSAKENSSMKETSRTEILKLEINERKRKSVSPHEGNSSKYKLQLEAPHDQEENECKQQ